MSSRPVDHPSPSRPPDDASAEPVVVYGQLVCANLLERTFTLRTSDGHTVEAPIDDDREPAILSALRNHRRTRVRLQGIAHCAPDGQPLRILHVTGFAPQPLDPDGQPYRQPPVTDVIDQLTSHITPDLWATLPTDLSDYFDDYLTGNRSWPTKSS